MGRIEAFALGNKPFPSLIDGLANGAGYGMILVIISVLRELFGSGPIRVPDYSAKLVCKERWVLLQQRFDDIASDGIDTHRIIYMGTKEF